MSAVNNSVVKYDEVDIVNGSDYLTITGLLVFIILTTCS
jgi:hypothetical protein